jgi:hypothetical protein
MSKLMRDLYYSSIVLLTPYTFDGIANRQGDTLFERQDHSNGPNRKDEDRESTQGAILDADVVPKDDEHCACACSTAFQSWETETCGIFPNLNSPVKPEDGEE